MHMVIFAHNTHDRPKTLFKTIKAETTALGDIKEYVSITSNGGLDETIFPKEINILTIPGIYHQINCINAFYALISKICEDYNDGIIIFTHDDVTLIDESVVKNNLKKFTESDLSYIVRRPTNFGDEYYMMEVVYLRIKNIKKAFLEFTTSKLKTVSEIPLDKFNKPSAEVWLAQILKTIPKGKVIDYILNNNDVANQHLIDNMGFYHINYGIREWKE